MLANLLFVSNIRNSILSIFVNILSFPTQPLEYYMSQAWRTRPFVISAKNERSATKILYFLAGALSVAVVVSVRLSKRRAVL